MILPPENYQNPNSNEYIIDNICPLNNLSLQNIHIGLMHEYKWWLTLVSESDGIQYSIFIMNLICSMKNVILYKSLSDFNVYSCCDLIFFPKNFC
jgi:hypothetical protein